MAENVLERLEGRVSYHDSVEEMLKRIRDDGLSGVFSRWEEQEKYAVSFASGLKLSVMYPWPLPDQ